MNDDPVTNKLAMDLIYTDETLQEEVEQRIKEIVKEQLTILLNNPTIFDRFLINNAYNFNNQVVRAVKDFMNNPRQIY